MIICSIYKSLQKEGLYLYVDKKEGLNRVPDALKSLFGQEKLAMTMALSADKKLAKASAKEVLDAIEEKGFYLQLPEVIDDEMRELAEKNSKLPKGG
ncbi:MAG: YcgL domain-containing protein [Cellvibrionales bacterium]|nr:YcgL domain-containing protein [Cellvibrionales bacterium]